MRAIVLAPGPLQTCLQNGAWVGRRECGFLMPTGGSWVGGKRTGEQMRTQQQETAALRTAFQQRQNRGTLELC